MDRHTPASLRVFAVLVLHQCELTTCETWQRLAEQVERLADGNWFRLLVCENEAGENVMGSVAGLPAWVEYQSRKENGGLTWAYDAGLARARATGAEWLLTLDQDVRLPMDFLERMRAHLLPAGGRDDIAAVVPQLVSAAGQVYSPVIAKVGRERAVARGFTGIAAGDVRAFNSGAMLRVRWLDTIGAYAPSFWMFWLDYLDHAIFRTLGNAGGKVWIAGDVQVAHHLSLEDGRAAMSAERFRNFIEAEAGAMDLWGSPLEGWLYTLRLVGRLQNQRRRGDPAEFSLVTRALLWRRLRISKQARLRTWMDGISRA